MVNSNSKQTTYDKRRTGLLKKAHELSVLCDAEVAVIICSGPGKYLPYPDYESVKRTLDRYSQSQPANHVEEVKAEPNDEVQLHINVEKPCAVVEKKQCQTKKLDVLKEEIANLKHKQLQLLGMDPCSVGLEEVLQLTQQLNEAFVSIKNKKEQILRNRLERANKEVQQLESKLENRVQTGIHGSIDSICNNGAVNGNSDTDLYLPCFQTGTNGSTDAICNIGEIDEDSDTELRLGPRSSYVGRG